MVMSASACGTQGHPLTGPAVSLGKTPPLIITVIGRIMDSDFIKTTLINYNEWCKYTQRNGVSNCNSVREHLL